MKTNSITKLADIFLKHQTSAQMQDFLEGILTPKEILELSQRIEIVRRLKAAQPQRQIAQEVGVGIATVTRGARELSRGKFSASWWQDYINTGAKRT